MESATVTVEGVPLKNYIEDKENKKKESDIAIISKGFQKVPKYSKPKHTRITTQKHGMCIIYSGREIMTINIINSLKDKNTKKDNVQMIIGALIAHGGTSASISQTLKTSYGTTIAKGNVSSYISVIMKTPLKGEFRQGRDGNKGIRYEYTGDSKITLAEAYEIYTKNYPKKKPPLKDLGIDTESAKEDISSSFAAGVQTEKGTKGDMPFMLTIGELIKDCIEKGRSINISIGAAKD